MGSWVLFFMYILKVVGIHQSWEQMALEIAAEFQIITMSIDILLRMQRDSRYLKLFDYIIPQQWNATCTYTK